MIDNIEDIVWLNDICDRLGMDTMTAGNLAALTIEASQRGKINESYDYGDAKAVADILFKTARRDGLGGLIAEGIKSASVEKETILLDIFSIVVMSSNSARIPMNSFP